MRDTTLLCWRNGPSDLDRKRLSAAGALEGELAWLIYIIGQVLGSHLTPNSNAETQQLVDGELTATVLQLVPLVDTPEHARERCMQPSNQHLQCNPILATSALRMPSVVRAQSVVASVWRVFYYDVLTRDAQRHNVSRS